MARKTRMHRDRIRGRVDAEVAGRGPRLGHLVDISMGGIGLSGSHDALAGFERGRICLRLPWEMAGRQEVEMEVERTWLRRTGAGRAHAGYYINRCDDADQQALEHLVNRFAEE